MSDPCHKIVYSGAYTQIIVQDGVLFHPGGVTCKRCGEWLQMNSPVTNAIISNEEKQEEKNGERTS